MRSLTIRHYVTVLAFGKPHAVVACGHLNVDARDLKEDIMLFPLARKQDPDARPKITQCINSGCYNLLNGRSYRQSLLWRFGNGYFY